MTGKAASKRRAVGVVRVSHVGDRAENIVSPTDQEARIRAECRRLGFRLLKPVIREMDVSGRTALERRAGLRSAVESVEAKRADAIVVSYFDRLTRSVKVQLEVIERVEAAGGDVIAVDVGKVTNGSASQRLSSSMLGLVAEYQAVAAGEGSWEGKVKAVAEGRAPFPRLPFWLRRSGEKGKGPLEHHPDLAPIAFEAVHRRAHGATIMDVRAFLAENGVGLSYHGVQAFLASRLLLGELHFGRLSNLEAFSPLVDIETFSRVQRLRLPRGRRPKSERLLARLGVLRCATCGSRMVVGTTRQQERTYSFYRCDPLHDCPRRVTIGADKAEQAVEAEVRRLVVGMKGKASGKTGNQQAAREFDRRQAELDSATRVVLGAGLAGEASATERLAELRQARDDAAERLEELQQGIDAPAVVLDAAADWDSLSLEGRRGIIKAVLARALVAPGRADDRIAFEARS